MRRREDPPLVQGRGSVPRADRLKVDVSAASRMPGVVGAWVFGQLGLADDYMPDPNPQQPLPIRRPVLARDEVRFEGDAVAVVAAETEYQAQDAVDAIEVDLEQIAPE